MESARPAAGVIKRPTDATIAGNFAAACMTHHVPAGPATTPMNASDHNDERGHTPKPPPCHSANGTKANVATPNHHGNNSSIGDRGGRRRSTIMVSA